MSDLDLDEVLGFGALGFLGLLLLAALTWATIAVACSARASGSPDYCVILMGTESGVAPTFRLWAHRPWSSDKQLGSFPTFSEAASASDRIGCPFKAAP